MDMTSMTMDTSPTSTSAAPAATSTGMSMGMDMGGSDGGHSCKISMLWNWNTIDACFLSSSWHVTSSGMFAGSCIGVVLLTMSLECLRRAGKEYDRHLARKHGAAAMPPARGSSTPLIETETPTKSDASTSTAIHQLVNQIRGFRPTVLEQAIRAFLHMAQFAVAYIIMLLAMYFNGYIIISIFIGAYIGAFVFHWETLDASRGTTSAGQDPTVCCA